MSTSMILSTSFLVDAFHSLQRCSRAQRLFGTTLKSSTTTDVAIVGGGLAGLGLAHNLLEKKCQDVKITIYDKADVGKGGASSVAGGLVHPLSPRGKIVHWGLEALASTTRLVESASRHVPHCVLRDKLYRVALTEKNVVQMKATDASQFDFCRWLSKDEMDAVLGCNSLGGLELSNGCRAIHVPSYLEGLHAACQEMGKIEWRTTNELQDVRNHDVVVWAGGSGMLQDRVLDRKSLPVELVRGQSLELSPSENVPREAANCGKYISPMLDNRMVVGATHEFKEKPLTAEEVYDELKEKSYDIAPTLWDNSTVDRITCGYRVQSQRTHLGRLPIMGHLSDNQWIFTGLSSRGLLHHGIYAEKLADMILSSDGGKAVTKEHPHLNWWR